MFTQSPTSLNRFLLALLKLASKKAQTLRFSQQQEGEGERFCIVLEIADTACVCSDFHESRILQALLHNLLDDGLQKGMLHKFCVSFAAVLSLSERTKSQIFFNSRYRLSSFAFKYLSNKKTSVRCLGVV
jgi:hypothetical protein